MIDLSRAKAYCKEYWKIENYEQALADGEQTWHCHHRKETDDGITQKELKKMGLYFNRPYDELIFLTPIEHKRLHQLGKKLPKETLDKLSACRYGKKNCRALEVLQLDKKTLSVIKIWDCINDAERELGILHTSICNCLKGWSKSAGGFKWAYLSDWINATN